MEEGSRRGESEGEFKTDHGSANDGESEADRSDVGAGIARAAARQGRSIAKVFARADIGSFPRKVPTGITGMPRRVPKIPTKQLASVTDRISTSLDAWSSFKAGHEAVGSDPATPASGKPPWWAAARRAAMGTMHAIPTFATSVVLGTVLFSMYEACFPKISPNEARGALETTLAAGAAGGLAGAVHGGLAFSVDALVKRSLTGFPIGTVTSHFFAHGTLFGSYEGCKAVFLHALDADRSDLSGAAAISAAGGLAGALQESVSHYSSRLEREGLRKVWRMGPGALAAMGTPSLRAAAGSAFPASLGFLSWEYAKDFAEGAIGGAPRE